MSHEPSFRGITPDIAVDLLMQVIAPEDEPSPAQVEAAAARLLAGPFEHLLPHMPAIVAEVFKRVNVRIGITSVLADTGGHQEWLPAVDRHTWHFWPRLEEYLRRNDKLAPAILQELDRSTDMTLGLLESPSREGGWDRRGLVMGHVQSGKTSHYTALAAKAIDCGYQIVIILAGVHNSLRAQTHERIDKYLIGRDSAALLEAVRQQQQFREIGHRIGVSALDLDRGLSDPPISLLTCTNSNDNGDFKAAVATQVGLQVGPGSRLVMVVKKNATILRHLIDWIRLQNAVPGISNSERRVPAPTLVIDDEADHASINTKDHEQDPTTINGRIRELLLSFDRVALVGYTATPFANIFIPLEVSSQNLTRYGDDLFPRSFIVNLKPASDYVGPDRVFGNPGDESVGIPARPALPMFCPVDDATVWMPDKHKKHHYPGSMPASLREAVRLFVLASAARAARGQRNVHNSMLVHATRFVNVQSRIADQIENELNALRNVLGHAGYEASTSERDGLRQLWEVEVVEKHHHFIEHFGDTCAPVPEWNDVFGCVDSVLRRITVMRVNGTSSDALKYSRAPEGVCVIAVGGDKLSRGLTLEGLSVSYFLRTSNMFDTLLQMGRWFGYRPGYVDLCRVYCTSTLYQAFRAISLAMEELRTDLDLMADAKLTPLDFGLRVRTPQDGLVITAANKIRRGEPVKVRFANSLIQTLEIPRRGTQADENRAAVRDLVACLGVPERRVRNAPSAHYLWSGVGAERIIAFLERYEAFATPSFYSRCMAIRSYIGQQLQQGELTDWTVALVSKRISMRQATLGSLRVNLVSRGSDSDHRRSTEHPPTDRLRMRGVVGSEEEALDLTPREYELATASRVSQTTDTAKFRESVRKQRPVSRGLLLIYLIEDELAADGGGVAGPDGDAFLPALAISFPASSSAQAQSYTVNDVWKQQYGLADEPDDDHVV